MKKIISFIIVAAAAVTGTAVLAEEYGANDYTGTVPAAAVEQVAAPTAEQTPVESQNGTGSGVKCFWGYRYYNCYYYTPTYYYYTPCTYYYTYTYSYRYYYRCRFITFYKSASVKSATNDCGILINEDPNSGTPLAAQGVVKGDVITHIDGKSVTEPSQIDSITASSKLVVLKVNGGINPAGSVAPEAPAVEYGAFEY